MVIPATLLIRIPTLAKYDVLVSACAFRLNIVIPVVAKVVPVIAASKIPADKIFLKFFISVSPSFKFGRFCLLMLSITSSVPESRSRESGVVSIEQERVTIPKYKMFENCRN